MRIIFATQNPNKVKEIQNQVGGQHLIESLIELNYLTELEETQQTLQGNALQKARFVYQKFGKACFADDTGLEIEALNGEPGVYSARYAGLDKSFDNNMNLVLEKLKEKSNRKAQFRTVIAFINSEGEEYLFEGICKGVIRNSKIGDLGFGYDPIFQPEGYRKTFAQMTIQEKSIVGHRGKATQQLIEFLIE